MKDYKHPETEVIEFAADVMAGDTYNSYCDCVGSHSAVCDDCRIDNCNDDLGPA